jgi:Flp pilus assembly protein TadG
MLMSPDIATLSRPSLRPGRRRRGQALAEFALVLPVFLLMTLGVVDLARMFTAYISLTNGVREAALFAGANSYADLNGIAYRIQVEANGMDASKIALSPPACAAAMDASASFGACDTDSQLVKITASYELPVLTPVLGAVLGGHIHLEATTVANILQ